MPMLCSDVPTMTPSLPAAQRLVVVVEDLGDAVFLAEMMALVPVALDGEHDALGGGVVVEHAALERRLDGLALEVVERLGRGDRGFQRQPLAAVEQHLGEHVQRRRITVDDARLELAQRLEVGRQVVGREMEARHEQLVQAAVVAPERRLLLRERHDDVAAHDGRAIAAARELRARPTGTAGP